MASQFYNDQVEGTPMTRADMAGARAGDWGMDDPVQLGAMALAMLMLWIIGVAAQRHAEDRLLLLIAGAIATFMALERGFYWNLFGRGHGFWTANRATALAVFALALIGPMLWGRFVRHDEE